MKNIMVTGAAGFAGRRIAYILTSLGYRVIGVIRSSKSGIRYSFPIIEQDLSYPIDCEMPIDAIVHAAGQHPGSTMEQLKRDNVDSMQNLMEFAIKKNIRRIIYLSTVSVYGDIRDKFINENTDIINPDQYGLSKYMAEILLRENKAVEGISLRLPGIFGPGSTHPWLVGAIQRICRGESVEIYSPDFMSNNFVHIDDLSVFIAHLLEMESPDSIFVLGNSDKISIQDCMMLAKEMSGSSSEILVGIERKKPFFIEINHALDCGYQSRSPVSIIEDCILDVKEAYSHE